MARVGSSRSSVRRELEKLRSSVNTQSWEVCEHMMDIRRDIHTRREKFLTSDDSKKKRLMPSVSIADKSCNVNHFSKGYDVFCD
jgi:hypothetical protein